MVHFEKFKLDNGLTLIVHEDKSTPMAVLNILYKVGARDEKEENTGFAHLFEHLMFGGSKNIENFDTPLQLAGGENNAFTNNDFTNYYDIVPSVNLETAFWLESDRMLSLSFDQKVLDVQKDVVCEEFKERYFSQPYGQSWLQLRPLAYKEHPYKWATIGKELSHIENATMDDVKEFFYKYYRPNNAIMVVSGNVKADEILALTKKWFGDIPAGEDWERKLPTEPKQTEARHLEFEDNVPLNAIYKAYQMCDRLAPEYHATDLVSDVLSLGKSSRLKNELVKKQKLFHSIDAYISGSIDNGLFIIEGQLLDGVSYEDAEKGIQQEIDKIQQTLVEDKELEKLKNKIESTERMNNVSILNRTIEMANYELLGDVNMINTELDKYAKVTVEDIRTQAQKVLQADNCSTLYYKAKKN